ncbi:hypothetical protein L226DRAFT_533094 [Lentinus tigrinus ALCF2SS1-7]|uniref:Extracellular membrane protein CFEM domain-containing protein n=1 Tax=Lentinus tigrinus ALCF2SS1-6 TaxID=1328759 RepID=A0A5C2SA45_9APHY|nr:hypothetical protein L227DRAFT_574890 [Lentinus tigrinus ALCF2SS1-6]RPD77092.1 hypothetical protein L226DRAFT_533094 [Lentinus tigrinus ALCF2SS1-7]
MVRSPLSCFLVAFFALLVGRVAAQASLTINVGLSTGNVTAADFLKPNDPVLGDCTQECTAAESVISACTNNACLCNANATDATAAIPPIVKCEQCMFNALITRNTVPQDPRAGQSSALSAYLAACNTANITVTAADGTPSTLTVAAAAAVLTSPPNWDGPFGQGLNTGTTVITVIAATILGGGLIGVLVTM